MAEIMLLQEHSLALSLKESICENTGLKPIHMAYLLHSLYTNQFLSIHIGLHQTPYARFTSGIWSCRCRFDKNDPVATPSQQMNLIMHQNAGQSFTDLIMLAFRMMEQSLMGL